MGVEYSGPERLPSAVELEEFFDDLMDAEIRFRTVTRYAFKGPDSSALALYKKHERHVGAVAVADRHFASYVGGAIAGITAAGVKQTLRDAVVAPSLLDSMNNVFNLFTTLLNARGTPALSYHGVRDEPLPLTGHLGELMAEAPNRIDYQVAVEGYGKGHMALLFF